MRLIPLFTAYAFLVFRPSTAADDTTALRALVDKAIEAHKGCHLACAIGGTLQLSSGFFSHFRVIHDDNWLSRVRV